MIWQHGGGEGDKDTVTAVRRPDNKHQQQPVRVIYRLLIVCVLVNSSTSKNIYKCINFSILCKHCRAASGSRFESSKVDTAVGDRISVSTPKILHSRRTRKQFVGVIKRNLIVRWSLNSILRAYVDERVTRGTRTLDFERIFALKLLKHLSV